MRICAARRIRLSLVIGSSPSNNRYFLSFFRFFTQLGGFCLECNSGLVQPLSVFSKDNEGDVRTVGFNEFNIVENNFQQAFVIDGWMSWIKDEKCLENENM
ncbi:hypothetical protein CDAR_2471 [Caerostris darwini]|uniref:Uncharacterized protein n=1 Tax=Caerostris darwini TaxID=1538125 RepID=A0AAV4W8S0_9ARAC|nr:hypothetical protein CDAR_2471 [Caerostris darwini]